MATIGVDVDVTIVRSDLGLIGYLNNLSGMCQSVNKLIADHGKIPYDVSEAYPDLTYKDTLDYWHQDCLYDDLIPRHYSIQALRNLSKDHDIVFVSTVVGNHYASKRRFLEKYFPFVDGFIATCDKQYAKVDILIDDRLDVLECVNRVGIIPVQFLSPYTQTSTFKPEFTLSDWCGAEDIITEINP